MKHFAVVGYIFGYRSMSGATFWGPVPRRVRRHLYYSKVSGFGQKRSLRGEFFQAPVHILICVTCIEPFNSSRNL